MSEPGDAANPSGSAPEASAKIPSPTVSGPANAADLGRGPRGRRLCHELRRGAGPPGSGSLGSGPPDAAEPDHYDPIPDTFPTPSDPPPPEISAPEVPVEASPAPDIHPFCADTIC